MLYYLVTMESRDKILKELLSANIRARREALDISQERLADLADVSIQTIKGIEGKRTWVSDTMLIKLSAALGVYAFQLLLPADESALKDDSAIVTGILRNLHQNIQDDINSHFSRLQAQR